MHLKVLALCLAIILGCGLADAETPSPSNSAAQTPDARAVVELSRQKWLWMAERNIQALDKLFDPQAVFVHMGATMSKAEELGVIESGRIQYKQADVQEITVRFIGKTAIVLSKIQLIAVVGGNEVTNPFTVTETFVGQASAWKLAALSFTRRSGT
jgi:4-carboxymuconolactone decarboxylase